MIKRLSPPTQFDTMSYRVFHKWNWDDAFITSVSSLAIGLASTVVIVVAAFNLTFWLLLMFVLPIMFFVLMGKYMHNSRRVDVSNYWRDRDKSIYYRGQKCYRALYQDDVKERGRELLQSIWDHETSLSNTNKLHEPGDCKPCDKRISLINKLAEVQHVPGTDNHDIESVEAFIQVKTEIKELM